MDVRHLVMSVLFCPFLIQIGMRRQILEIIQNAMYYEKPSSGVALFRAGGRTDFTNLIVTKLIYKRA
jgi:hypothetical protein